MNKLNYLLTTVFIFTLYSTSSMALLNEDYVEKGQVRQILDQCNGHERELVCIKSYLEDLIGEDFSETEGASELIPVIRVRATFDQGPTFASSANNVIDFFNECRKGDRLPFAHNVTNISIKVDNNTPTVISKDFFNWMNHSQMCGAISKVLVASGFSEGPGLPQYTFVQTPEGQTVVLYRQENRQDFTTSCYTKFMRTQASGLQQLEISVNFSMTATRLGATSVPQLCGMIADQMMILEE